MHIPINLASEPFRKDRPLLVASGLCAVVLTGLLGVLVYLIVADRINADFFALEEALTCGENGLEHRRGVRNRLADCAQHLGGGFLLLQRLLRFAE